MGCDVLVAAKVYPDLGCGFLKLASAHAALVIRTVCDGQCVFGGGECIEADLLTEEQLVEEVEICKRARLRHSSDQLRQAPRQRSRSPRRRSRSPRRRSRSPRRRAPPQRPNRRDVHPTRLLKRARSLLPRLPQTKGRGKVKKKNLGKNKQRAKPLAPVSSAPHIGGDETLHRAIAIVARHVARAEGGLEETLRALGQADFSFLCGGAGSKSYECEFEVKRKAYVELKRTPATERELRGAERSVQLPPPPEAKVPTRWITVHLPHGPDAAAGGASPDVSTPAQLREWVSTHLREAGERPTEKTWLGQLPGPGKPAVVMAEVEVKSGDADGAGTGATSTSSSPLPNGTELQLPIEDVYFSHNQCSETFSGPRPISVLQTVIELWSGSCAPGAIPLFGVVWHCGRWHVRTGNRRLMVWRLLRLYAPELFSHVTCCVAEVDDQFLQRRFTTGRNGPHCRGSWVLVRETGEFVGRSEASFGVDLLDLILGRRPERPLAVEETSSSALAIMDGQTGEGESRNPPAEEGRAPRAPPSR